MSDIGYGTGRIHEIIDALQKQYNCDSMDDISVKNKLDALCVNVGLDYNEFDDLIMDNSPVLRTVKGHVFETFFDALLRSNGYEVKEIGGDKAVDREVNGFSLQLKTPTLAGTRDDLVQYKTHKTHGAKSELESLDYYHQRSHFADFLVGLISYDPLNIIFIPNNKLPPHPKSPEHILSPFTVNWRESAGLNNFKCIGVDLKSVEGVLPVLGKEHLPRLSKFLNVTSEAIVDTILNKENFRIWDMAIRGFAREKAFERFAQSLGLPLVPPLTTGKDRADKADHAIPINDGKSYVYLQMKGVSTNNCTFDSDECIVGVETQLTRGRVNDHPTQSRLYLKTDFDYLIIGLDPALTHTYRRGTGIKKPELEWEFYSIPTEKLECHPDMPHRLKSLQKFSYLGIQDYQIVDEFKLI